LGWIPPQMRPSSIRRPSAGRKGLREGLGAVASPRERAGGKERSREASWGNISGNKGMGTSVSMVIPSSGYRRRAGKRPSHAPRSLPARRGASRRSAARRVAEGQETSRRLGRSRYTDRQRRRERGWCRRCWNGRFDSPRKRNGRVPWRADDNPAHRAGWGFKLIDRVVEPNESEWIIVPF